MQPFIQSQLANSVIMVRPDDFEYNQQTGADNEFQHKPRPSQQAEVTRLALNEFSVMVSLLESFYIEVLILEKKQTKQPLPDAIFPNNWFSTRSDGSVYIYPMKTENRQAEVQIDSLVKKLTEANYNVAQVIDLHQELSTSGVLEGTGSLIFHHPTGKIFAAYSERCHTRLLTEFAEKYHYRLFPFNSATSRGNAIYHTNVLMSCGEDFVVIAKDQISQPKQRKALLNELDNTVSELLFITEQQMAEYFCANILQLKDKNNQACIVMSSSAYNGFKTEQKRLLEKHGSLIICDIPTIETVGGGSARCILAENFLIKNH